MVICVHLKPWDGDDWVLFVDMGKLHKSVSTKGTKRVEQNEEEILEKFILKALKSKEKFSGDMPWLYELFTEDDVKHFTIKKFPIQVDDFISIHVEC